MELDGSEKKPSKLSWALAITLVGVVGYLVSGGSGFWIALTTDTSFASIRDRITQSTSETLNERDPIPPRVLPEELEAARQLVNPLEATPENIAKGKFIFEDKGTCMTCHGREGQGDGKYAHLLDPSPRNFTNAEWQQARTDGELFWVIAHGSPGTDMDTWIPEEISEEEGWQVITYIRRFSDG